MSGPGIEEYICPPGQPIVRTTRRRARPEGQFVKGPVPLDWIVRASRAGGACLAVGMVIRAFCGMGKGEKANSCVQSHRYIAELLHCSESKVRNAVKRLVEAGLVECNHRAGRRNEYRIPGA